MNLIEEVQGVAEAERTAALRQYMECLTAGDQGDVRKLRKAMDVLGFGADRLKSDIAICAEAKALEIESKAPSGLSGAIEAAGESTRPITPRRSVSLLSESKKRHGCLLNSAGCKRRIKPHARRRGGCCYSNERTPICSLTFQPCPPIPRRVRPARSRWAR
jgi:hypothetical protein